MNLLEELKTKETAEEKPIGYQSKNGFEQVKLLRGFTEIKHLFYTIAPMGGMICGGYARYCASTRIHNLVPANDVDIYCQTEEIFSSIKSIFTTLEIKHENDVSVTYKKTYEGEFAFCPTIQLIKPVKIARIVSFGTEEEILSNFDFTVVRAAILNENTVLVDADFIHDESKKILRLKNIHCPISSTLRCMKYASKGYWLKPLEALKLFIDWQNRDQDYKDKLIDFLVKANDGKGLTKEEVENLEALMMID